VKSMLGGIGMSARKLGIICAFIAAIPNLVSCESSLSPDVQFQKQVKRAQECRRLQDKLVGDQPLTPDRDVVSFVEQPPRVRYRDGAAWRHHTFDFYTVRRSGRRTFVAIKHSRRVERSGIRRTIRLISDWALNGHVYTHLVPLHKENEAMLRREHADSDEVARA
jgi:hypothetical protein